MEGNESLGIDAFELRNGGVGKVRLAREGTVDSNPVDAGFWLGWVRALILVLMLIPKVLWKWRCLVLYCTMSDTCP